MGFLDGILGRKKAPIETAKETAKPTLLDFAQIAEIPANDGYSFVVRARDSSMNVNGQECFVRRYPLLLKLPEGQAAERFTAKSGGDAKAIQTDGSIAMIEIPGEAYIAGSWLETFAENVKAYGIELPQQAIYEAISADMSAQGEKYLEPIVAAKKEVRAR